MKTSKHTVDDYLYSVPPQDYFSPTSNLTIDNIGTEREGLPSSYIRYEQILDNPSYGSTSIDPFDFSVIGM
jgi:hypothetical protein